MNELDGIIQQKVQPMGRSGNVIVDELLSDRPAFAQLTVRERSVCLGILTGYTSEAMAINMSISINSVLTYRKRIYEKLGITSQNELFLLVIKQVFRTGDDGQQIGEVQADA
jgi:DNA-binding CsgD family transcriptional regulator